MRIQVLLRQDLKAVRIDESAMVLYALTAKGEARLELHANCRDEAYLRQVREAFSTHVLGSPGGYPIFLKRWTRMGQTRLESLQSLLLLGEPEAVVAVAHAKGLDEAIARRAWWAMPTSDVARRLLENDSVARGELGRELAAYLLEFLPFEEEPNAMIDSVRLVLTPGLIDGNERLALWRKAGRKTAMYVGFLLAEGNDLPQSDMAPLSGNESLQRLAQQVPVNTGLHQLVCQLADGRSQTFLDTTISVLSKMANQDVALQLFRAIQQYFNPRSQVAKDLPRDIEQVLVCAQQSMQQLDLQFENNVDHAVICAIYHLAHISEQLLNPIFAQTDAVGSVMRKRMQAISDFVINNINVIQGKS